jgi:hypothetical protein
VPRLKAEVFDLIIHRLDPTSQPGFAQSLLRLAASFSGSSVKVSQINIHAPPVTEPGFSLPCWQVSGATFNISNMARRTFIDSIDTED